MNSEATLIFIFGLVALVVRVYIAIRIPEPTPDQQAVFRILLALAAAGVVGVFPGMMDIKSHIASLTVAATGAMAVFVFVCMFNPKTTRYRVAEKRAAQTLQTKDDIFREIEQLHERIRMLERLSENRERMIPNRPVPSSASLWSITVLAAAGIATYSYVMFKFKLTSDQYYIFRMLFSILAAGIGSVIPGFVAVRSSRLRIVMRIVSAIVMFTLVYFFIGGQAIPAIGIG